ncbi:MAG: PH domain-containing protein [Bowdeniella nasicola]|nr:PH domain-containing protein [Bowdeniella nasicola]
MTQVEADNWRRVHWVTPLVWAVKYLVIFTLAIVSQIATNLLDLLGEVGLVDRTNMSQAQAIALITIATVVIIVVSAGLYSWLTWRNIRYAIGEEAVYYHHGIIFRKQRYARLDRIQAVDMVRPLLARFFGLVAIDIQTAGGSGSNVQISYVKEVRGEQLRNEILARAAGVQARTGTTVLQQASSGEGSKPGDDSASAHFVRAPHIDVLTVTTGRLLASVLMGVAAILAIVVVAAVVIIGLAIPSAFLGAVGASLPLLLVLVGLPWSRFIGAFNFTLQLSPDGIRSQHGLFETRAQTIPPRRIQAVTISQPLLWRAFGWWRIEVNIAGYGRHVDSESTATSTMKNTLLPVGTLAEAMRVVWLVIADPGIPQQDLAAAIAEGGRVRGFEHVPTHVKWIDWFTYRRRALCVTNTCLVMRDGFFTRTTTIVPHERIQSVAASQGPIEKLLQIANLHAHSVPGPVTPVAKHLPAARIQQLVWQQAERARIARASEGPEQWMRRVGVKPDA